MVLITKLNYRLHWVKRSMQHQSQ